MHSHLVFMLIMKKINTHLLYTRSILAFHIAAKEQSFTRAAKVLNIGQSAISHAVRQLEERLGIPLFIRQRQGVTLTPAGKKLAKRLQAGFYEIETGLLEAQASQHHQRVTLSVSTSLASHWLMPRIVGFKQAYPRIQLRCITHDTDADLDQTDFDLCIPLGQVAWQGYQRWKFTDEEIFPVFSPHYLASHPPINTPADLLKHPLIHLEERYTPRFDWVLYFRHFGIAPESLTLGETYNDYSIVVQAAIEGQGVALGWKHIVQPLIEQGRLMAPAGMNIQTNHPFYLLAPDNQPMREECVALLHWLLAEIKDGPVLSTELSAERGFFC